MVESSEAHWLAARRRCIAATDAARILTGDGLAVWEEKRRAAPERQTTWPMRRGLAMEPLGLDTFEEMANGMPFVRGACATGHYSEQQAVLEEARELGVDCDLRMLQVSSDGAHRAQLFASRDWMGASPDGIAMALPAPRDDWPQHVGMDRVQDALGPGPVQVKSWGDDIRDVLLHGSLAEDPRTRAAAIQTTWEADVLGCEWGALVVVFWSSDPIVVFMRMTAERRAAVRAQVRAWCDRYIETDTPPPPEMPGDLAVLGRIADPAKDRRIILREPGDVESHRTWRAAEDALRLWRAAFLGREAERNMAKADLLHRIGPYASIVDVEDGDEVHRLLVRRRKGAAGGIELARRRDNDTEPGEDYDL